MSNHEDRVPGIPGIPDIPEIESSTLIFNESLITVRKEILLFRDGNRYPYYTLITKPYSVLILALTSDDCYVLTEEYRHPVKKFLLSCPGGYMEEGEDPLPAARRELLEETGYTAESFKLLGAAYPYPGISAQKTYFVKAENAKRVSESTLEVSEIIETLLLKKQQIYEKIGSGIELDGPLCTALFFDLLESVK